MGEKEKNEIKKKDARNIFVVHIITYFQSINHLHHFLVVFCELMEAVWERR